ncbi:MAG TPA: preprotein translocase subunit YajC [Phycisphaerales bacterium]|nr:preprotein translocase subunit YajC [Phycisphaerales bacterium]
MHDWVATAAAGGIGLWQEGGNLPTEVPGIDQGGGAAETVQPGGAGAPSGGPAPSPLSSPMFLILLLVVVFMFVTTIMSGRKEKRRVAEMIAALKRGDRVQTLAGIIGTVHEVRDDSVVVRVDEATGTKMQFAKSAVQHVLKPARAEAKEEDAETGG